MLEMEYVEKVKLFHVETHKYPGLKLFHDSECDITKQNKITNLDNAQKIFFGTKLTNQFG
jgi:hypothetical protein